MKEAQKIDPTSIILIVALLIIVVTTIKRDIKSELKALRWQIGKEEKNVSGIR